MGPRLRESQILTSSGREERVHATLGRPYSAALFSSCPVKSAIYAFVVVTPFRPIFVALLADISWQRNLPEVEVPNDILLAHSKVEHK